MKENNKMKPNFTQTPNIIFDELLPELSKSELKVLIYLVRRTYGFHKGKDQVSLSQFMNGIEGLDRGTGLGRANIVKALNSLKNDWDIVIIDKSKRTNTYSLNLNYGSETKPLKIVSKRNQNSIKTKPKIVSKRNTQKKEKESIQNKASKQGLQVNLYIEELKELNLVGYTKWFANKTQRKNVELLIKRFTLPQIKELIRFIKLNEGKQFFPTIATPTQLVDKLPQIEKFYKAKGYKKPVTETIGL